MAPSVSPPFHCAFTVKDIESTRKFYGDILGCKPGRFTEQWIDFDFFGHQISAHVRRNIEPDFDGIVDGVNVPVPHFGCILSGPDFDNLIQRLREHRVEFIIEPRPRFEGQPGEQRTLFIKDFSGNALEFKSFKNFGDVFKNEGSY